MGTIGNRPADVRASLCRYCGSAFFDPPTGYGVCDTCDTFNLFSDAWKDETGCRPRFTFTLKYARAYLESRYTERTA